MKSHQQAIQAEVFVGNKTNFDQPIAQVILKLKNKLADTSKSKSI